MLAKSSKKSKALEIRILFSLLLIILLPSFYFVSFKASSLAPGLLMASLLVLIINYDRSVFSRVNRRIFWVFILGAIFLLIVSLFGYIRHGSDKSLTAPALVFMFFSAYVFSRALSAASLKAISSAIFISLLILIAIGWLGLFKLSLYGEYLAKMKAVPPFAEQSHYALSLGLISTAYAFVASKKESAFICVNILAFSLLFPNLTLLVFFSLFMFVLILRLKPKYVVVCAVVFPVSALYLLTILLNEFDYFSSRLAFADTQNLTALVWIQGWQLAYKNILGTGGLGVGFQLLGLTEGQLTDASYAIKKLASDYQNIEDGGFFAAKLISEFGVAGVVIIVAYICHVFRFAFGLGLSSRDGLASTIPGDTLAKRMIFEGFIFSFLVECFFRGYGYFSPGLYLVFAARMAIMTFPGGGSISVVDKFRKSQGRSL